MKKKLFALLLSLAMAFSLLPVSAVETAPSTGWLIPKTRDYTAFTDTAGTIAETAAKVCCETGLMDGVRAGKFSPGSSLTNAQVIVIAARLHKLLTGGTLEDFVPVSLTGDKWYTPYAAYLTAEIRECPLPLIDYGDEESRIAFTKQACERYMFMNLMVSVLQDAEVALPNLNHLESVQLSVALTDSARTLYDAGICRGVDKYGSMGYTDSLTRGAAAVMLARVIDPAQRLTFTLETFDLCRDIFLLAPETVLMSVGNTSVTAEEFSYTLSQGAVTCSWGWYDCTAAWSRTYLTTDCSSTLAMMILAKEQNVSLTQEEEATCAAQAKATAGINGVSEAGYLWWQRTSALKSKLVALYNAQYGDYAEIHTMGRDDTPGESHLKTEIFNLLDTAPLQTTATFDRLNLSAVRERLLATGCYVLQEETYW